MPQNERFVFNMSEPWVQHSKPTLAAEDYQAVEAVLRSGHIAAGPLVETFEHEMAAYLALAGGVATSSGTSALTCALIALGVGAGDEVIFPSYVCVAVLRAVRAAGAVPVLCDIGDDWCMNVDSVRAHMSNRTRAIIVVHTFGIVADVSDICGLGVPVVEDCCQALGSSADGRVAGTWGDACVLSLHATKLLTTGTGGMALSRDHSVVQKIRRAAGGESGRTRASEPFSDLQAALGLSQLHRYEGFVTRRRALAETYFARLGDSGADLPCALRDRSLFFRFPVRVTKAFDVVQAEFAADQVHVRHGVDAMLHVPCDAAGVFETTERCFAQTVSLPIYPSLTDAEQERVIASARRALAPAGSRSSV
jgi:dTDP-4-amino-4,6-dideoxygalactose transaminase